MEEIISIDWPVIIRALVASGLTQPQIAAACKCGQSTVSDMLNGKTEDPRTTTGLRMLGLARGRGIDFEVPAYFRAAIEAAKRDAPESQRGELTPAEVR